MANNRKSGAQFVALIVGSMLTALVVLGVIFAGASSAWASIPNPAFSRGELHPTPPAGSPQATRTPCDACPTREPFVTRTPDPNRTPFPTREPFVTRTPDPNRTPYATRTPDPNRTQEPHGTPDPNRTPGPRGTPDPNRTQEPHGTPVCTGTPAPKITPTAIVVTN